MLTMDSSNYDFMFKILITGENEVGKTELLSRFCGEEKNSQGPFTINKDFDTTQLKIEGHELKLQLWDPPNQERYRSLVVPYYRGTLGVFLVYDMTQGESFIKLRHWIQQARENCPDQCVISILANRSELHERRQVSREEGEMLAQQIGARYFEVSAQEGTNVMIALQEMATDILEALQ